MPEVVDERSPIRAHVEVWRVSGARRSGTYPSGMRRAMSGVVSGLLLALIASCAGPPSESAIRSHLAVADKVVRSAIGGTVPIMGSRTDLCPDSSPPEEALSLGVPAAGPGWSVDQLLSALRRDGWHSDPPGGSSLGAAHRDFGSWTANVAFDATSLVITVGSPCD